MGPLRVLLVSWEYPPVMYGGLGRHVHALSHALSLQGHEVVVLTQGPPGTPAADPAVQGRPRVQRAVLGSGSPDVYADTARFVDHLQGALVQAAEPLLAHWRPDVVHGHDWVVAEAAASLVAAGSGTMVVTVHATEAGLYQGHLDTPFSRRRHAIEQSLVAQATRTIVCSTAMHHEVVRALAADPERTVVVPNGVDVQAWQTSQQERDQARRALGLTSHDPLLVLVGRLEWEKGAQDAIEALGLLADEGVVAHLALIGNGARRDDLARQAQQRGVAAFVHPLGRMEDAQVTHVVAAADVALVPSRYEPFGIVALEAMAAGTPVVVTSTGGLPDLVEDGISGLVVPPAAPEALASAIGHLLADASTRESLAAAARQRVITRFSWDRVAQATVEVYRDADG